MLTDVHDGDLVGTFGCPDGDGPFPGVVALGGSDGGIPDYFLELLVPAGFACLALAYFDAPDTQRSLIEVPLERIERGLRYVRAHPRVTARKCVTIIGSSKGGELALLTAATFPDLTGSVVVYTPSAVVWAGLDFTQPFGPPRSSWSHRGRPLPFVPFGRVPPGRSDRGVSLSPIYEVGLENDASVLEATIPVERATGPLLLISGGVDRMWPAERMCRMVLQRMQAAGRGQWITHLNYPTAGHQLFPWVGRLSDARQRVPFDLDLGGSSAAAASAHAAAWPQVVRHLSE